ncbi:hypothetical protein PIB30_085340 [Stylosanthes scabra]|uniref:Uncharacterized protein n=1 Tax=Stylosanthes scabra TaxID=79078 RepID=A0ABU6US99_9FABA|nr:hypothetical protein [Stylosanthes scabra]
MDGNPAFMNGQGWQPCQVGYHSDGSSDGYFSCEDSLSACQIDNVEFPRQPQSVVMFETLEEGVSAITLHSGTRLKGPTGDSSDYAPITPEGTDTQRNVERKEEFPTIEQEAASSKDEKVVDPNFNSLPYPSVA